MKIKKPCCLMRFIPLSYLERNYVNTGLECAHMARLDLQDYAYQLKRETMSWAAEYIRRGFRPITFETFHEYSWGRKIPPSFLRVRNSPARIRTGVSASKGLNP